MSSIGPRQLASHALPIDFARAYPPAPEGAREPYWLEAWRHATELARRRTPELRVDLSYGKRRGEKLDLYLPNHRPRNLPFVAFVHGGGWEHALRPVSGYPASAVLRHDAALAVIGFDALPTLGLDEQAAQVGRAWQFLLDSAQRLGLDPRRGHLIGHSSGALLAAHLAFSELTAQNPPRSAVLLSGIYDLSAVASGPGGEVLALDAQTVARLSPLRHVPARGPATVIGWGEYDTESIKSQSRELARRCRAKGLTVTSGELPGRGHVDSSLTLTEVDSPMLQTLRMRAP